MKRIISLCIIFILLFSIIGCKKSNDIEDEGVLTTEEGPRTEAIEQSEIIEPDSNPTTPHEAAPNPTTKTPTTITPPTDLPTQSEGNTKVGEGFVEEGDVVTHTKTETIVDENFHIISEVTNINEVIPDEDQGLEKSARRATAESKYNFDKNPLINRDRQQNKTYMPSFNMDDTGFVRAGTKISDLKGKTLQFFTSDNFAAWSYRNEKGETIDEWKWFAQLKNEIGLNIKYTVKQHMSSVNSALQYMNAGKQCDIVYSSHVTFPSSICISRSITDKVNINNLGSSPGVCKNTMDTAKWGNSLRLIAPIGVVDVIWYNQTLTQELGLSDPHTMWEYKQWNWDTFKAFQLSIPKTTKDGTKLVAFVQWPSNCSYIWPSTNGAPRIYINADADQPGLINNWDNPLCIEAWEFITSVCNSVTYGCTPETSAGIQPEHMGMYEGTTLMSATMYTQVYRDTEYSKHVQINWVPYPKSTKESGKEICQYYGFGMMLPKKTAKEDNVNYALKFMELWATRFTETIFDNLNTFEYYNFNYKQRKQYFDFVTKNVVFALAMNDLSGSGIEQTNFFKCFRGDAAYNVKTEAAKASNLIRNYIVESLKFGQ